LLPKFKIIKQHIAVADPGLHFFFGGGGVKYKNYIYLLKYWLNTVSITKENYGDWGREGKCPLALPWICH